MRILITNDDGLHAAGIAVLEQAAAALGGEIWVVAPDREQSGQGRSVTLSNPLRARRLGERRWSVDGSPADCVVLAMSALMRDCRPDLVLSGINAGYNIADDVFYSGTIGAAMEAAVHGVRAIALSQAFPPREIREEGADLFSSARACAADVLKALCDKDMVPGGVVNVNFPPCPAEQVAGAAVTRQGKRAQNTVRADPRVDARHLPYYWLGFERDASEPEAGTDLRAMRDHLISVTALKPNLTCDDGAGRIADAVAALRLEGAP